MAKVYGKEETVIKKLQMVEEESPVSMMKPGITPDARENQLIALATNLAEKQLREGTASSQVITHYLKLASSKERLEKEILEKQKELITAKTESLRSNADQKVAYEKAIEAMRKYSGAGGPDF